METVCVTCGSPFQITEARKKTAKFCSVECKLKGHRIGKECRFCGKTFEVIKGKEERKYCSHKCSEEDFKKRILKTCEICGTGFEVQQYATNAKYCSIKCRNKGISKKMKGAFLGNKSPTFKGGKTKKKCACCGKIFEVFFYRNHTAKHCSIKCSKLDTSKETREKIANSVRRVQKENPMLHPNYILSQKGHETKIEKLVKEELIRRNLTPKIQYKLASYWLDFAFPKCKIAIECDGNYWHSKPTQIRKDGEKEEKIKKMGWKLLRFKETEILKNVEYVGDKIELALKQNENR